MNTNTVIFAGAAAAIVGIALASSRRASAAAASPVTPNVRTINGVTGDWGPVIDYAGNESWRTVGNGMPAGYSDDTRRLAGVQQIYNTNAGQTAAVEGAIQASAKDLNASVYATQPEVWAP